jgi:hypothetical protein
MSLKSGYRELYEFAKKRVCVALRLYGIHLQFLVDYAGELYLEDPMVYETVKLALLEVESVRSAMKALCGSEVEFRYIDKEELGMIYYKLAEKIGAALKETDSGYITVGNWYYFMSDFLDEEEPDRDYKRTELAMLLEVLGVERDGTKMIMRRDVAEAALQYICSQLRRYYIPHKEDLPSSCRS